MLDGILTPQILPSDRAFLETFTYCTTITFNACNIVRIDNLPAMPKLKRLELSDNKIARGLEVLSDRYPKLEVLKLCNNRISELIQLVCLSKLTNLTLMSVVGNPIAEEFNITTRVFELLPGLQTLDGIDREGNDVNTDDYDANEERDEDDEDDYGDEQDFQADGCVEDPDADASQEDECPADDQMQDADASQSINESQSS